MDSIWQQHRTFILKILGGLGVCLLIYIVWSSVSGPGVERITAGSKLAARDIGQIDVPSSEAEDAVAERARILAARIEYTGQRIGETRTGDDLRDSLIREILKRIGRDDEEKVRSVLTTARRTPLGTMTELIDETREHLITKAGYQNVLIDEDLGFATLDLEAAELPRYLLTLRLIIDFCHIAIEERVYEVRQIGISPPPIGRFQGEEAFVREYPLNVQFRGSSESVLRVIARLNRPDAMIPIAGVRRIGRDRSDRNPDTILADMDLLALRVDTQADLGD